MVAAEYLVLEELISIAELVAKEILDYNYIYPVMRVSHANHGDVS